MKSIFTLAVAALSLPAAAQITLNQSSYSNWSAKNDIAFRVDTTQPFPALAPATNASWNFSAVVYNRSDDRLYRRGPFSRPAFPNATHYGALEFPINASIRYSVREASALTANGFVAYGQWAARQGFSLTAVSGGPNDSLIFPEQEIPYSSVFTTIKFPATMGTTWSSDINYATDFSLTIAAFGLANASCKRKTHLVRNDEVVGWGSMTIRDSLGNPSGPTNVLMVKATSTITDSFFVSGQPAPTMLLTAFGLTQGQVSLRNEYFYYRAGERMPLVQATYRDNSFQQSKMDHMDVHMGSEAAQSVQNFALESAAVSAYPNPVRNQTVHLRIGDKNLSALNYQLINMNGQVVAKGTVAPQNGEAKLHCQALETSGIYFLQLFQTNTSVGVVALSVE